MMSAEFPPPECQVNYAATVRAITPFGVNLFSLTTGPFCGRCPNCGKDLRQKSRIRANRIGIIELTAHSIWLGGTHDYHHGREVCRSSATRRTQSPSSTHHRSSVPEARILRSSRFRSGSVRDVAARPDRRPNGRGGGSGLRLLTVRLLRSQGSLSAWRIASSDSSSVWATTPAQAKRTDPDPSPRMPQVRSGFGCRDIDSIDSRRIRRQCSSAQRRAGTSWPAKKGAAFLTVECPAELWTERYESLRQRVLILAEAGWEHALVVAQGLAAWMLAWPQASDARSISPLSSTSTTPHLNPALTAPQQSQLAQILAGMILQIRPEVPS